MMKTEHCSALYADQDWSTDHSVSETNGGNGDEKLPRSMYGAV